MFTTESTENTEKNITRCLYGNTLIEMFSKLSLLLLFFVLFVPRDWLRGMNSVPPCTPCRRRLAFVIHAIALTPTL